MSNQWKSCSQAFARRKLVGAFKMKCEFVNDDFADIVTISEPLAVTSKVSQSFVDAPLAK